MTLTQLREEVNSYSPNTDGEYHDKMMHTIPDTECADRVQFILSKCMDKVVLDIGCLGPLHSDIEKVAKEVWGIDRVDSTQKNYWKVDVEKNQNFLSLTTEKGFDLIICGEILEHLSNPGLFLENLKKFDGPIIITVPNAFANAHPLWLRKGIENVNSEHVAFYSYTTFKTLISRYNYKIEEFYWAGEPHFFSEGLIFVIKQMKQGGTNGRVKA